MRWDDQDQPLPDMPVYQIDWADFMSTGECAGFPSYASADAR